MRVTKASVRRACAVCDRTLLQGEHATPVLARTALEFVDVCPLCQDDGARLRLGARRRSPISPALSPRATARSARAGHSSSAARNGDAASRSFPSRCCDGSPTRSTRSSRQRISSTRACSRARSRESHAPRQRRSVSIVPLSGVNSEVVLTFAWDITWYQYRVVLEARASRCASQTGDATSTELEASVHRSGTRCSTRTAASVPDIAALSSSVTRGDTRPYTNYVGGEWVDAASGETFESTSPADGELIGVFPLSGAEDVDRAVAAAKEASTSWRLVPAPKRGEILFRFAQLRRRHKAELTELMTHEMGKVKAEAGGDVQEAIDMSYYMAGEGRRLFGQTTPSELPEQVPDDRAHADRRDRRRSRRGTSRSRSRPGRSRPRSSAGNTVVFKPATDTPAARRSASSRSSTRPASRRGCVNIVHGGGGAVGERLVRHPDVPVITLTGSREIGVTVLEAAPSG